MVTADLEMEGVVLKVRIPQTVTPECLIDVPFRIPAGFPLEACGNDEPVRQFY